MAMGVLASQDVPPRRDSRYSVQWEWVRRMDRAGRPVGVAVL